MPTKRYSTEQIVSKLRQAEEELSRGLRTPAVSAVRFCPSAPLFPLSFQRTSLLTTRWRRILPHSATPASRSSARR